MGRNSAGSRDRKSTHPFGWALWFYRYRPGIRDAAAAGWLPRLSGIGLGLPGFATVSSGATRLFYDFPQVRHTVREDDAPLQQGHPVGPDLFVWVHDHHGLKERINGLRQLGEGF